VLIILFLLLAPHAVTDRMMSIADFNHPAIQARFIMWETGIKIIKDYFFLGIGDTDLMKIYNNYKIPQYNGEGVHLHNNFLQVFLLFGIFGFVIWLLMIGYITYRQIKIYLLTRNNDLLNILAVSSLACTAAFLTSGLTEYNFGDFEFAAVLWFTLALAFLAEKFYLKEKNG
jgi:O-antigen ligase